MHGHPRPVPCPRRPPSRPWAPFPSRLEYVTRQSSRSSAIGSPGSTVDGGPAVRACDDAAHHTGLSIQSSSRPCVCTICLIEHRCTSGCAHRSSSASVEWQNYGNGAGSSPASGSRFLVSLRSPSPRPRRSRAGQSAFASRMAASEPKACAHGAPSAFLDAGPGSRRGPSLPRDRNTGTTSPPFCSLPTSSLHTVGQRLWQRREREGSGADSRTRTSGVHIRAALVDSEPFSIAFEHLCIRAKGSPSIRVQYRVVE